MSEQPQHSWLERLLATEAERAITDEVDLWPRIARRLHERGSASGASLNTERVFNARGLAPPTTRGELEHPPFSARAGLRIGEVAGAAISVALIASVIVVFAIVASRPADNRGATGLENPVPERAISAVSTPRADDSSIGDGSAPVAPSPSGDARHLETEPAVAAGPDCTIDLDILLGSGTDGVYIPIRARSSWGCPDTGTVRLTIIDAAGKRAAIAGNPATIPLSAEGGGRQSDSSVVWSNWCGERERFRIETRFGDEQRTHALPDAPRCVNALRPSTMRVIRRDAAPDGREISATPMP
jgi:hypothetical protein